MTRPNTIGTPAHSSKRQHPMPSTLAPDLDNLSRRFGGLQRLYGAPGAARIRAAHVVIVGLGGVGSWAAEALARSGVGQLTLIDMDHIAESNVNRQIHALTTTLGQAKVEAMRARIAHIHPACRVHCVDDFVSPDNWPALLPAGADAVIDACDQIEAKTAIAAHARATGLCLISAGAAGGKRLAHRVDIDDLSAVTHDPLLARLRQRLRKYHGAPAAGRRMGIACVFSREPVARPLLNDGACAAAGGSPLNCHGYGSSVAVTATFGHCAAGWVMERLAAEKRRNLCT